MELRFLSRRPGHTHVQGQTFTDLMKKNSICQIKILIHIFEADFCNLGKERFSLVDTVCPLLEIVVLFVFSKSPQPQNFYYFIIYKDLSGKSPAIVNIMRTGCMISL